MTAATPIPHTIMAMLRHLSGEEFKVVGVLCYQAFAEGTPATTVEQIQVLSGLMAQQIKPTMARLARRGLVLQQGSFYQIIGTTPTIAPTPTHYDPALGIRPERIKPNLLYPEGPWLTERGYLSEDFVRDRAEVWRKGNSFRSQAFGEMAIEDVMGSVCKHYLKPENHANLEIDWQSYVAKGQRYLGNVQTRIQSGVTIDPAEQAQVLQKLPLFQQSLELVYETPPTHLHETLPFPEAPPQLPPKPLMTAGNLAGAMPTLVRSMPKAIAAARSDLSRRDRLALWLADPILRSEAIKEARASGYGLVYGDSGVPIGLEDARAS
jgi:hypothetical protein